MSDGKVGGPIEKSHLRGIIYDIAVLTFLTLETSQKSFDIADFFYFEETFRSECSERNERRGAKSGAKAGVPFGVAEAED